MKRIVSIKFEDGTEREVLDIHELRSYVNSLILQEELRAMAADTSIDWQARRSFAEAMKAHLLRVKETKRNNAKGPRTSVTKEELLKDKDQYERDNGTSYGWLAHAERKFGVTRKTLNTYLKSK